MTSALRNHCRFAPSRNLRDANACGWAKEGPQSQHDGIHHTH